MFLHAYMFRSTYLGVYAMFPWFCPSFCFMLMIRVMCSHARIMSMVMLCLDLCARMLFARFYAQIRIRTCLHAWIHVLPCLGASFHMFTHALPCLCLDLHFHMFICLDLCSYMLMCLDLFSICFMPSSMCLCAPCHVCVPRPRLCLSCHVLL